MKLRIVQFFSVILLVMVTGVFWGTWFTLTRSLDAFPVEEFIHNGKVIINNLATPMRIIFPLCIFFVLWTLWLTRKNNRKGFYFTLISIISLLIALLITLLVEVPIDNQIKTWTVSTVPSNWAVIREKWGTFHGLRTFASLASIYSYVVPIIFAE
ncbi:anthrone oxygenase family protein [Arachidicoccus terrestris]|uniref:anthrone oxygenase family protein n=1 Tax=Arachidicoccus terrestris TaxID=2875539 RepID=UPI001CC5519A|nr:anthrone oxygenase family protein [Arachidicoccus terrestris]UAY55051.1 DUF1772 domain-containing protein [Arachidicoccus terrestris]